MGYQMQVFIVVSSHQSAEVHILVLVRHLEVAYPQAIGSTVQHNFVILVHFVFTIDVPRIAFKVH